MLRWIVALAFAAVLVAAQDAAAVSIFHSPTDNPADRAVALIPDDGSDFTLNLWFDPEPDETFGYNAVLTATSGLTLKENGFAQSAGVLFNLLTSSLGVDGGEPAGDTGPSRIGTLIVNGTSFGATFSVTGGSFTNADFDSQTIAPLPQLVGQVVPEPGTALLLGAGLVGLGSLRRGTA